MNEKKKTFKKNMYKIAKENNIFKILKGMIRRGTMRLNGKTLTGFNKKFEINKSAKESIKEVQEF